MNLTIVLSQIMGIVFTALGVSMLVNKKVVSTLVGSATQDGGLLWSWGLLAVTMGAVLIALNNFMLSSGTQLLIAIFGWLALLKGLLILLFPKSTVSLYKKWSMDGVFTFSGILAVIFGLIFLYAGFM